MFKGENKYYCFSMINKFFCCNSVSTLHGWYQSSNFFHSCWSGQEKGSTKCTCTLIMEPWQCLLTNNSSKSIGVPFASFNERRVACDSVFILEIIQYVVELYCVYTNYHKLSALKITHLLSHNFGSHKYEMGLKSRC